MSETSTRIQLQTSLSYNHQLQKFQKDHSMMKCTFEVDSSSNHLTLGFYHISICVSQNKTVPIHQGLSTGRFKQYISRDLLHPNTLLCSYEPLVVVTTSDRNFKAVACDVDFPWT